MESTWARLQERADLLGAQFEIVEDGHHMVGQFAGVVMNPSGSVVEIEIRHDWLVEEILGPGGLVLRVADFGPGYSYGCRSDAARPYEEPDGSFKIPLTYIGTLTIYPPGKTVVDPALVQQALANR